MRTPLLLIAVALMAACSEDVTTTQAQSTAAPPPAPAAATEQGDVAAAEVVEPTETNPDPCDLRGYDMSKMTADRHEELVKLCQQSKQ